MPCRAVIAFGCPRSGTTFLREVLASLTGVFTAKLVEHAGIHPCHSDHGLIDLAGNLRSQGVTFVRIVRHPMQVADSFIAARRSELSDLTGTIPEYDDEVVVRWITSESEGSAAQWGWFKRPETHGSRWVEVRYGSLHSRKGREDFVASVCRDLPDGHAGLLSDALEVFGDPEQAANYGRLSHGIERAMSEEQAEWFAGQLQPVMEREGYER